MIREVNQLHLNPLTDYIDGQSLTPLVNLHASISNPNTHEPLQQQRATSENYIDQALDAAVRVHRSGVWRNLPADERAQLLEHIADELDKRQEEIATIEALTSGIVIRQTRALARLVPLSFRQAAKQARSLGKPLSLGAKVEVQRVAWGPVALIIPWGGAATAASHKIASALIAGCPVILKPSEWSPHSSSILAEVIAAANLPAGTFQLVHGGADVGTKLVSDPRVKAVSFSGGLNAGRMVAQTCAVDLKPLQLELGGVNAMIVLDDADLDATADGVVTALTTLNGAWRRGLGRLLVHRSRYHALLRRVLDRLETLNIGDSLSPESDMGPLIHAGHLQVVQDMRERLMASGGVAHMASKMPDLPGYFMEPTLITNTNPADSLEEILGPVAAVHMFKDDSEAIMLANQPQSGAICYVYTADEERGRAVAQEIEAASISINGVSLYGLHPQAPRAGWGLSGLGEAGVIESLRFFTGTRAIGSAGG
jgi:acyl-CoA reductase-like NAD-dependent aldehyde dehydrogenase